MYHHSGLPSQTRVAGIYVLVTVPLVMAITIICPWYTPCPLSLLRIQRPFSWNIRSKAMHCQNSCCQTQAHGSFPSLPRTLYILLLSTVTLLSQQPFSILDRGLRPRCCPPGTWLPFRTSSWHWLPQAVISLIQHLYIVKLIAKGHGLLFILMPRLSWMVLAYFLCSHP